LARPEAIKRCARGGWHPALINALQMIASELYCSKEQKSGRLSWDKSDRLRISCSE
jgi:hypothetical protein